MKCYKNIIVIICFFVFACVKVAMADSYTITFKTGSNTTSATTSTSCSDVVDASSVSYLSGNLAEASRCYHAAEYGLRLGNKDFGGTIKMILSSAVTPTSIVVSAKKYSEDSNCKLTLNDVVLDITSSDFANYTFNITSNIAYLKLQSKDDEKKRIWIESITDSKFWLCIQPLDSFWCWIISLEYNNQPHNLYNGNRQCNCNSILYSLASI